MTSPERPPLTPYVPEEGVVIMRRCDVPDHPDVEIYGAGEWFAPMIGPSESEHTCLVRYRPERQVTLTVSESTMRELCEMRVYPSALNPLMVAQNEMVRSCWDARRALAALDGGS